MKAEFLPPEGQAIHGTDLGFASIDPHQAFILNVDIDNVKHVFYYHVPTSFGMWLYLLERVRLCTDFVEARRPPYARLDIPTDETVLKKA